MTTYDNYPRDMIGYGPKPPHAQWPNKARVALQFVLNYEEGGENSVLHGDAGSETFLSEIIGAASFSNRHMSMESLYEYGSRAGLWRLLRMFEERKLPLTIFGVSMALKRHPEAVAAFQAGDWGTLGSVFEASHLSMRDDFEISCAELDAAVAVAVQAGAVAARFRSS